MISTSNLFMVIPSLPMLDISGAKLSGSSASLGAPLDNRTRTGSIHSIDSAVQGTDADMAVRHMFDQVR